MGLTLAKPSGTSDNHAKADADLALSAMNLAAENFLNEMRLGQSSVTNVGYSITDQKVTAQEIHLVVQSKANAPKAAIKEAIDGIFSSKWQVVTEIVADALVSFLAGPVPAEEACNDSFMTSFLKWDGVNVVQYSVLVKRTNASSVGTLTEDQQSTMMSVIAKGNVDYATVDPQTVLGALHDANPDLTPDKLNTIASSIVAELKLAAQMAEAKGEKEQAIQGRNPKISFATTNADAQAATAAESPLFEVARYNAIQGGQRVKVDNKLTYNVMINGSLIFAGRGPQTCAVATKGNKNAINKQGETIIASSQADVGKGATLTLSPDSSETSSVILMLGKDTIIRA